MNPLREIEQLKKENKELRKENQQFKEIIITLLSKVASLEERLAPYENPKKAAIDLSLPVMIIPGHQKPEA